MYWATIQTTTRPCDGIFEPEFRCDHHAPTERSEGFTNQLLVRERTIHLGGVEEGDAAFNRRPYEGDHLRPVRGRTVAIAHSHATEPNGRNFQIAESQFSLLHSILRCCAPRTTRTDTPALVRDHPRTRAAQ